MQWGKYGIISEAECVNFTLLIIIFLTRSYSMYDKDPEFRTWLVEERIINPETMSKDQTKKEFARFVEDYNTGMHYSGIEFTCLRVLTQATMTY